MNVAEKTREIKALDNKVRALEKDLSVDKPLVEIRGIFWTNITQSLSDVWRSIQDSFSFPIRKLDSKGERRYVIFWTSVCHNTCESPYTYYQFIDWFIHPASTLLIVAPPPRLSGDIKKIL